MIFSRVIILLLLFISLTFASPVEAKPIPAEQWTPRTAIWLSRAMVAEAGFEAKTDHAGIAHVLAKRWRNMIKRWPNMKFISVVFRYAKGLGDGRRQHSRRQLWVRALTPGGFAPEHWPRKLNWEHYRGDWRATLLRARAWAEGRVTDPCRGKADHWGGTIDVPWKSLVPVDCGDTENTFYRVSIGHGRGSESNDSDGERDNEV